MKYIAYGSNLNLGQMARRCPTAKVVGTALLQDYQLTFRCVATIVPKGGAVTPVGVWEIDEQAELSLDRYEGYPHLYRKEYLDVVCNGEKMNCLVYIMNDGLPSLPNMGYFNAIRDGYRDVGLDESFLITSVRRYGKPNKRVKENDTKRAAMLAFVLEEEWI